MSELPDLRFGPLDTGYTPPKPLFVASAREDGYSLFLGYSDRWCIRMDRSDAVRLSLWVIFRWWIAHEWFGLRLRLRVWRWRLTRAWER